MAVVADRALPGALAAGTTNGQPGLQLHQGGWLTAPHLFYCLYFFLLTGHFDGPFFVVVLRHFGEEDADVELEAKQYDLGV